jgi:metallophosphoesterase (TIGR00282 family)
MLRILFFGDVVGRPGRTAVERYLRALPPAERPDLVVANGENASGGRGIDPATAEALRDAGVDVITTGNHVWHSREIAAYLSDTTRVLRPANYPPDCPGTGWTIVPAGPDGVPVAVVNLVGRVFMGGADCPFRVVEDVLAAIGDRAQAIVVDMHAEATSEKCAMGRFLDGRVAAVIGTHTHVQTADEQVLAGGTAYLTDVGMCGPSESILGVRADRVIERFLTQMPNRFEVARGPIVTQGVALRIDGSTRRAVEIRRIRRHDAG